MKREILLYLENKISSGERVSLRRLSKDIEEKFGSKVSYETIRRYLNILTGENWLNNFFKRHKDKILKLFNENKSVEEIRERMGWKYIKLDRIREYLASIKEA